MKKTYKDSELLLIQQEGLKKIWNTVEKRYQDVVLTAITSQIPPDIKELSNYAN